MIKIKVSTRLVFVFQHTVIKIPLSRRGYLQGKNEGALWGKYRHLGILGELRWERFGVVLMKRYDELGSISAGQVNRIKTTIPELNIINCDLHNVKNWGKDPDLNPVLLDYGITQYISTLY